MRGRTARTPKKEEEFLLALASGASVSAACGAAAIGRTTAYEWRQADERFSAAWDAAVEAGTDVLEDEARRRAHDGVLKPVFQGGKHVGDVREYSDTLLIFLLNGRRPEKFRQRHELTGKNGTPLIPTRVEIVLKGE